MKDKARTEQNNRINRIPPPFCKKKEKKNPKLFFVSPRAHPAKQSTITQCINARRERAKKKLKQ